MGGELDTAIKKNENAAVKPSNKMVPRKNTMNMSHRLSTVAMTLSG